MKDVKLEAEKICNSVEDISRGKLNNKEDLFRIIELAVTNKKMAQLEELSFHAKFSQGLIAIIQKKDNKIEDEYFSKAKTEFLESIGKVKILLEELIFDASDFLKTIFREKYLKMTQQGMNNLNNFCSDLGFLKLYLNDVKRNSRID